MAFKDYWKEKAEKRRIIWEAKAKRFAKNHAQLEVIRKGVYLPLDFAPGFDFDDYKRAHYTKSNPIVQWQQMDFNFSESGLRAALAAEGADMDSFKMEVSRQSIKGKEAPKPKNEWEAYRYMMPNKCFDYEKKYHAWLRWIYEICSEVEDVHLTYRQVTMTIRRYSAEGSHLVYAGNPITTDVQAWTETHHTFGVFVERWSRSVQDFLARYFTHGSNPFLTIDFIDQKL